MKQLIYVGSADTRSLSLEDLAEIGVEKAKDPLTFTRGRVVEVPVKVHKAITEHESLAREFAEPRELSDEDIADLTHGQPEDPEDDEEEVDESGGDSGEQVVT